MRLTGEVVRGLGGHVLRAPGGEEYEGQRAVEARLDPEDVLGLPEHRFAVGLDPIEVPHLGEQVTVGGRVASLEVAHERRLVRGLGERAVHRERGVVPAGHGEVHATRQDRVDEARSVAREQEARAREVPRAVRPVALRVDALDLPRAGEQPAH